MNAKNYLNIILTIIVLLLLANLLLQPRFHLSKVPFTLLDTAYGQEVKMASGGSGEDMISNIQFYPLGAEKINKFVFFDQTNKTIYVYSENGKLLKIWHIQKLGQDISYK